MVNVTPQPLYPRERPGTHCIGGWVGSRTGLEGCGKSRPPTGFDPRTVQPVASRYTGWDIPTHIHKTDTEICKVIYYVCSCECGVNSLREICRRFNIWTRHLWKKFTSRPCISIAGNKRWVVYVGRQEWKVGLVLCYQSRSFKPVRIVKCWSALNSEVLN